MSKWPSLRSAARFLSAIGARHCAWCRLTHFCFQLLFRQATLPTRRALVADTICCWGRERDSVGATSFTSSVREEVRAEWVAATRAAVSCVREEVRAEWVAATRMAASTRAAVSVREEVATRAADSVREEVRAEWVAATCAEQRAAAPKAVG